jgi:hypothetical protein
MSRFRQENLSSWENSLENLHRTLHPERQSAGTLSPKLHDTQKHRTLIVNFLGAECERRGIRVRLGGNSYRISAKSDVYYRCSQQGFSTDSGKVCSGVKCDIEERMYIRNNVSISETITLYSCH